MTTRRVLALGALLATATLAGPALSQDGSAIRLEAPWARRAPMMGAGGHGMAHGHAAGTGNGAVYVTIRNTGSAPDALLRAETDAAETVELHETTVVDGVMRMRPLPRFAVPPGGAVEMRPGGHHIMLLGLRRSLEPGGTVTLRLTFEKAGPMTVDAPVR